MTRARSILRLGTTPRATANGYSFISTEQAYNVVEVAAGATATLSVAGSAFAKLLINGNTTLTSAATIGGTLAVGPDVVLRAAAGQTLAFASAAPSGHGRQLRRPGQPAIERAGKAAAI